MRGARDDAKFRQAAIHRPKWRSILGWVFLSLLAVALMSFSLIGEVGSGYATLSYSAAKRMIRDGEVVSATFQEHAIAVSTDVADENGATEFRAVIPA